MENKNKPNSVKDDKVANYLISHNITDLRVKYLVWFGFQHQFSDEMIELYAKEEYSASVAEAKYIAVLLGEKSEDINSMNDITEKIIKRTLGEIFDRIQKETKENSEDETFYAVMESNMEELAERMTTGVSNLESSVIEEIDNVKNIMNACVDSILELSECNLSLLKVAREEQKLLTSVHSDFSTQNKEIQDMKDMLMDKAPEKKSFFRKIRNKENTHNTGKEMDIRDNESVSRLSEKQLKEENKRLESIRKYNEIVERMNEENHEISVMDILNLLRTGLFNKEQAAVVTEAIKEKLTIPELIEIVKPEQSAETMRQILSFLLVAREGEPKKEKQKVINRRSTAKTEKEEEDIVLDSEDNEEDDYSFS